MSQTFVYSFTFNDDDAHITVTADDNLTVVQGGVTGTGNPPYSTEGYAVTAISGSVNGQTITGMVGQPGAYAFNQNIYLQDDSTIYPTGASDEFKMPTGDGLSNEGIAFTTDDGMLWNLIYGGNDSNFQLIEYSPTKGQVAIFYTDSVPPTLTSFTFDTPCYCEGARLLTERGEVAVEDLVVGDMAVTASGARRPIVWIGRRAIDCSRQRDPRAAWPVRIAAHAFGENQPTRDLWVSPGHNIAYAGALMPACELVNGVSVTQEPRERVVYFHVELDAHDLMLAEGLAAESYLDQGNRAAFENGAAFLDTNPDWRPKRWSETCLPIVHQGPALVAAKQRLLDRLGSQGFATTVEPDLHVLADGVRVSPLRLSGEAYSFALSADAADIRLCSRRFVPAETQAESQDRRTLGVCVGALSLDGAKIDLADDAAFAKGWWGCETNGNVAWRWTQGEARLPAGTRTVIVSLSAAGPYRVSSEQPLAMTG